MTLDGKILRGCLEHEKLKPVNIRTNQGNVPKSCTIERSYECWTQNLKNIEGQDL